MSSPLDPIDEQRRHWQEHGLEHAELMVATTSLVRARQLAMARVDSALEPLCLTYARLEALAVLYFSSKGELPLGKIGQRLMIHATSVTQLIDRLEKDGLVERLPHPSDRRGVLARITPTGRARTKEAIDTVIDVKFGLAELTTKEANQLNDIIRALRVRSGDHGSNHT